MGRGRGEIGERKSKQGTRGERKEGKVRERKESRKLSTQKTVVFYIYFLTVR